MVVAGQAQWSLAVVCCSEVSDYIYYVLPLVTLYHLKGTFGRCAGGRHRGADGTYSAGKVQKAAGASV